MEGIGGPKPSHGTPDLLVVDTSAIPNPSQKPPVNTTLPPVGPKTGGSNQPALDPPQAMSMEEMILALQALQAKVMDAQAVSSKNDIQANLAKKTTENDERIKQLQEAIDKMADAKKSGLFGKIFGWIATIASLVVAAALIATGVGAVAGAFLLAGAVVGLGMQIFNTAGGMEWIAKEFGQDAAQAFMWTMMAIQIVLAIGSLGAGLASSAPALASTAAQTAAQIAKAGGMIVGGVAAVGQGASTIATAVSTKDAQDAQANAKEIEAAMLKLQAMIEEEMKRLKKILDEMQEGASTAMQILASSNETKSAITQKLGV